MRIPEINLPDGKIYIVTDTHFGARGNSVEWLDIMIDYFESEFIPKVSATLKPNDILIHCGDVYDNRQSLNLQVLSRTVALFSKLGTLFKGGVHVIAGNHDVMRKYSNEITSLDSLAYIPNIHIYKDPHILNMCGKRMLLLPWCHSHDDEKRIIDKSSANLVFCHTNFLGCKFDRYRSVDNGLSFVDLQHVERVYSGHIHYSQDTPKVNILGTPYQISRSDMDNAKGFWILDPKTMSEHHELNYYSPMYKKVHLNDMLETTPAAMDKLLRNNRLDLLIPIGKSWNIDLLIEVLQEICFDINIIAVDETLEYDSSEISHSLDFRGFLSSMVEAKIANVDMKGRILKQFDELYKKFS